MTVLIPCRILTRAVADLLKPRFAMADARQGGSIVETK